MIRIMLLEDHVLVGEAIADVLTHLGPEVECVVVRRGEDALARLEVERGWDLVIVDLMLPDMSGMSLLGVLGKRYPEVPALVVSGADDQATVRRAMKAGASGFFSKSGAADELLRAVNVVLAGGIYSSDEQEAASFKGSATPVHEHYGLTRAQTRVMELLVQGRTNRQIADLLGLSEGTVKLHVSAIFRALQVSNRAMAMVTIARHEQRRV